MKQETTRSPVADGDDSRRRGVRRTVTVLVAIVAFFFLISFVQIVLMK
ncbi:MULTISPECIES: hypothetical protein [Rhodanobacter]|uniref:DUF2970 domain-containing protein n=1 Tax=Rhodanobacter sp. IGA1.0 TaxID=3158582 RepID=A0AAU7QJV7_9GAMM|nr:hypothetical protein [Rhodanobacter spathiphylli]